MRVSSLASSLGLGLGIVGMSMAAACNNPVYLEENRPLEAQAAPAAMGGGTLSDTDLFVLPVRQPTAVEAQALVDEQAKLGLPMPVPWMGVRDVDLEIEWTLKNLEDQEIDVRITVNGGNEFGDYDKTLFVDMTVPAADQTPPPDLLGGGKFNPLAAGETRHGVFREDELREAALDLEAITRYPPPDAGMNAPFMVLVRHSSASTIGLEGIPATDVTPAMVRMSILLEASGRAVLDYSVRAREKGSPRDKLATPGAPNLYVSTAATLPPPTMPAPAAP